MNKSRKLQITRDLQDPKHGKIVDLSSDRLSSNDLNWLAEQIKKSAYLEEIILPPISIMNAGPILTTLYEATRNNSTLMTIDFKLTESGIVLSNYLQKLHQHIQSRLSRNRNRIFAIHGGGNIGLGLMADVISKSVHDYNIIATSDNEFTRSIVNRTNEVWLQHGESYDSQSTCIHNIEMVSRRNEEVLALYMKANLAAICVTPSVFSSISHVIASALITRYHHDGSGLKILILMNIPNCAQFVLEKLRDEILALTRNVEETEDILSVNRLIPTVIDRIVTPISKEVVSASLNSKNSNVCILNAEMNYSFYVSDDFSEAPRFPKMTVTNSLKKTEDIKNKYINGPHAIMAWMGALKGHENIADAIKDPDIYEFIDNLMRNEIAPVLLSEYPDITTSELDLLRCNFFARCHSSTNDPVTRVARDPLRKLDRGGRIRGTLELMEKNGLCISTSRLESGIAAGVLYALSGLDSENPGCEKMKELYIQGKYSYEAILCYSGDAPSGKFTGLHSVNDAGLLDRITAKIDDLNLAFMNMRADFPDTRHGNIKHQKFKSQKKTSSSHSTLFSLQNISNRNSELTISKKAGRNTYYPARSLII